ncbi:hypothetical protein CEXT_408171 [Caerostris extrusa]|uniref:NT-3 n=1 Tax=Caerostris extrusa TaxID=172846 RepID=A0AAV4NEF7_CAEEX|nr:hypothetical protein CEXT_408171 [Caerostris extrusa]
MRQLHAERASISSLVHLARLSVAMAPESLMHSAPSGELPSLADMQSAQWMKKETQRSVRDIPDALIDLKPLDSYSRNLPKELYNEVNELGQSQSHVPRWELLEDTRETCSSKWCRCKHPDLLL